MSRAGPESGGRWEPPWVRVEVHGELEKAEREWLHTNGTGAYAMSTLALMHTRRYHGLLVAPLERPVRRHVIVNQLDSALAVGGRTHRLSTHQFPGVAATPGYRVLESFSQDPLPRWVFRIDADCLEMQLCLAPGHPATVVAFTWYGSEPATLSVRPLFAMRPMHEVTREHGAMIQRVTLRHGEVEIQPVPELPPVVFGHEGVFMGSPDWWRRFEYSVDRSRGAQPQEDLWTPGTFEIRLASQKPSYLSFGLGRLPQQLPAQILEEAHAYLLGLDPGPEYSPAMRRLTVAADQFRIRHTERPAIISGYPWLDVATRDALISLPGLYLVEGRLEDAKAVLRVLLKGRKGALLTRGLTESGQYSQAVSADTSLWLFEAVRLLDERLSEGDRFVAEEMLPVLADVFEAITRGGGPMWVTPEGLLANGSPEEAGSLPLTWMDSRADGVAVTQRAGLAVELQALWFSACRTLQALAGRAGDPGQVVDRARRAAEQLVEGFQARFWCEETRYPFDCLPIEATGVRSLCDMSVRPNAVIALALAPELFSSWQAVAIVERARERLLTPAGLRTLESRHPDYRGDFRGLMWERRAAYHQGTCWAYLLGFFARAACRVDPNDFELQIELRQAIERLTEAGPVIGQVAQVASGDPPFDLGGCPAQAWSVAELLRALIEELER